MRTVPLSPSSDAWSLLALRSRCPMDTLASFSEALGREISANDMTPAIDKLVAGNLIVRKGHGSFDIADPFVKQVWQRHRQLRQSLIDGAAQPGNKA